MGKEARKDVNEGRKAEEGRKRKAGGEEGRKEGRKGGGKVKDLITQQGNMVMTRHSGCEVTGDPSHPCPAGEGFGGTQSRKGFNEERKEGRDSRKDGTGRKDTQVHTRANVCTGV